MKPIIQQSGMHQTRFQELSSQDACQLLQEYGSPIFIIDQQGLLERYQDFQQTAKHYYSNSLIAMSYKTNSIQALLAMLYHRGAYAEVVSGDEYQVARSLNIPGKHIIFNGPLKTDQELMQAIEEQAYINCDHFEEVLRLEKIAKQHQQSVSIGLRLCFHELETQWSRFGFYSTLEHDSEAWHAVSYIARSPWLNLAGLHAHIGTNIRELEPFAMMAKLMAQFAKRIKEHYQIELSWIDVGGGLAGISPRQDEQQHYPHALPDLSSYVKTIVDELKPYLLSCEHEPLLIFEPGRTLLEPFAGLLTQVTHSRVNQRTKQQAIVCNAGVNVMSTSYVYNHPFLIPDHTDMNKMQPSQFFGPTCNQADQLYQATLLPTLEEGDPILFYGVGAYCMAFSYSFIRYRPGVILWHGEKSAEWLRLPENLQHQRQLERIPNFHEDQYAA